eukprot:6197161-Pleurochrysis_carterae.AAC.3
MHTAVRAHARGRAARLHACMGACVCAYVRACERGGASVRVCACAEVGRGDVPESAAAGRWRALRARASRPQQHRRQSETASLAHARLHRCGRLPPPARRKVSDRGDTKGTQCRWQGRNRKKLAPCSQQLRTDNMRA